MHITQLRDFCLSKKGVTEHFPFDNVTLVFKVMNKIFLIFLFLTSFDPPRAKVMAKIFFFFIKKFKYYATPFQVFPFFV